MKYEFLDIVVADIAFDAYGENLGELFENAGEAVSASMIDIDKLDTDERKKLEFEGEPEEMLHDFLCELVFLKDSEQLFFKEYQAQIKDNKSKITCKGSKLDLTKHEVRNDVKAVTYHEYKLERTHKGWKARVVLDV